MNPEGSKEEQVPLSAIWTDEVRELADLPAGNSLAGNWCQCVTGIWGFVHSAAHI